MRYLFMVDAAVLFLLGALLIFFPRQVEAAFGFRNLPPAVSYLLGLWGGALGSLAIGYFAAARDPWRHRVWALVGIARGALECLIGLSYVSRQIVTINQAAFGIIVAGAMTVGYIVLYPWPSRISGPIAPGSPPAASK